MPAPTQAKLDPAVMENIQRMRYRSAMARKKRKDREAAGEISELNLTAMMDMMTIILVFLLKSFSASTVAMTASADVRPPISSTRSTPKDTVAVTITSSVILVGDKEALKLNNWQVPPQELQGRLMVSLDQRLKKEVEKLKTIESRGGTPFTHELSVIGDRKVPYDLLLTVLYTAGQNELENYRFVVVKKEGG